MLHLLEMPIFLPYDAGTGFKGGRIGIFAPFNAVSVSNKRDSYCELPNASFFRNAKYYTFVIVKATG